MKKLSLFLAVTALLFGCKREGPQGPPGQPADFTIINKTVNPSDWEPLGEPGDPDFQYYASYSVPQIDQFAFNNALIIGYLIDNGVAFILPNTINYGDWITEFSMIHAVGIVEFIAKDSDLQTQPPNNPINFRVYIIEASARVAGMEDWEMEEMEAYIEKMGE
jgi:hypothetical protein